ncbi:hypothetical protein DPMN_191447 [Dreissena polymorpha]|uniref:Uncharacterized protein n=1 Tax=Dreissena polymorpha TaxID=45954 RepID=A0A9D4BCU5_DREPO|nr:hypothetical protein DPMN_191447 [Dreissena polymorpha]
MTAMVSTSLADTDLSPSFSAANPDEASCCTPTGANKWPLATSGCGAWSTPPALWSLKSSIDSFQPLDLQTLI